MSIVQAQDTLGIGRWTSAKKHDLGLIYREPAHYDSTGAVGPRTYMYVQFVTGGGVAAHSGSPVGFTATTITHNSYIVSCDVSTSPSTTPVGVICNNSSTAVTTTYYGWIQLAVPFEVLKSVLLTSGTANNALVVWEVDQNLATATAFTSLVDVIDTPWGIVCTAVPDIATSASSLVSTSVHHDVMVLLNPYVT